MSKTVKLHVKAYITLRGFRWRWEGSQLTALESFSLSKDFRYPPVSIDAARILKVLICLEMGQFKRETRSRFAPFRSGSHVNKLKQLFFRTKIQVPSTGKMRFIIYRPNFKPSNHSIES